MPVLANKTVHILVEQLEDLEIKRQKLEEELTAWHQDNKVSQRVATVPGVGVITATAIAATITDPNHFKSGRQFAAFLGLVPRQFSSGGKERLGRISKKGNRYLRRLLIVGATSMLRHFRHKPGKEADWMRQLLERRSPRVVSVALANKMARIVWAVHSSRYCISTSIKLYRCQEDGKVLLIILSLQNNSRCSYSNEERHRMSATKEYRSSQFTIIRSKNMSRIWNVFNIVLIVVCFQHPEIVFGEPLKFNLSISHDSKEAYPVEKLKNTIQTIIQDAGGVLNKEGENAFDIRCSSGNDE